MIHDWKYEFIDIKGKLLTKEQVKLLEQGSHNLSSSWMLAAMYHEWKRIKGIKEDKNKKYQTK